MEITTQETSDGFEVRVSGRLDAYWADHLAAALEDVVRDGKHHILLNMADVAYMSSVGIRVLLRFYKQLQRINGSFAVSSPSEAVRSVLELAGLAAVLVSRAAAPPPPPSAAPRRFERGTVTFEVFDLAPGATLSCRVVGEPERLAERRFDASQCRSLTFPATRFGVGLGAFGTSFADSHARFGEFLCAGGAAAYLPTDGSNVPDYLVSTGALIPELSVLYALICEGRFAQLARFEMPAGEPPIGLSALALSGAESVEANVAGMVMIAESAGLVGAALRRSPAQAPAADVPAPAAPMALFGHPQIREWLSFTPEHVCLRSLVLVVGVVARVAPTAAALRLTPLLRPLGSAAWPAGHFHAAAFSYAPLQKGPIELQPTVASIFEGEALHNVLHLLNDDRAHVGTGESAFLRGACWLAPIGEIVAERS